MRALLAIWILAGCGGQDPLEPTRATEESEAPASPTRDALATVEVWASFSTGEGYAFTLWIERDGCFRQRESIGGPGGDDTVFLCTGCVPASEAASIFAAAEAARMVPEERAYDRNVEAMREPMMHRGAYSSIGVLGDGSRVAPPDERAARALIAPMQRVLDAAAAVIEAGERRSCTPRPG